MQLSVWYHTRYLLITIIQRGYNLIISFIKRLIVSDQHVLWPVVSVNLSVCPKVNHSLGYPNILYKDHIIRSALMISALSIDSSPPQTLKVFEVKISSFSLPLGFSAWLVSVLSNLWDLLTGHECYMVMIIKQLMQSLALMCKVVLLFPGGNCFCSWWLIQRLSSDEGREYCLRPWILFCWTY